MSISAQTRYLDDIGETVSVSSDIVYGSNIGIITQAPVQEDLKMDVYTLDGDTVTDRPVVIMLHTGTFLPAIVNGQATGDKTDNAIVEMCKRFARKGYVAVALNYRLGWNPVSPSEDVRRSTLIQAAYRGLQDVKTAVRYMRKSIAEENNPYGIKDNFAVGGYGTGGYLSLSLATLNDYESELLLPKFMDTSEETIAIYGQPMPYIIQSVLGNFEGTDYGMMPMDLDGDGIPETDVPLCIPNHVGYSSEVDMVFNAGGALPEISWLEQGEVPMASLQNIADPDAPYAEGNVIVPTTGEFVIVAHGSKMVQEAADSLGNNAVFEGLSTSLNDATYGNGNGAANAMVAGHNDLPGLFGMITPTPASEPTVCGLQLVQNAPWDWWDNIAYTTIADQYHGVPEGTMGCLALLGNPDMSEEKGMAMADMLSDFFTPRVYASMVGTPVPITYGCTDESFCNYNDMANFDDGSCYNLEVSLSELVYETQLITASTNVEIPTYTWTLDGVELENTSAEYTPTTNGEYSVTATDDNGCTATATVNVANVSIEDIIESQLSLYPNPAKDVITIKCNARTIQSVQLYSVEGKLLENYQVNNATVQVHRNNLAKGLYFIGINIDNKEIKKAILFE
jgi:dienelactone hydrolase